MEIRESFGEITADQLSNFEKGLGGAIPDQYRNFLLTHNGGKPNPNFYDFYEGTFKNSSAVKMFFGISASENEKFDVSLVLSRMEAFLPENILPIGIDIGRNLICVAVSGDDKGYIYHWDADWAIVDGNADYSNLHMLARSFDEFLSKLYI